MSDQGIRSTLPDPTKRLPTRFPGVYYRLNAKGERRYQISYTDSAGARIWKTVDGQLKDAVRTRNQILERMHRGERVVQSKMTVKDLSEKYLRTQTSHLKRSTYGAYEYSLDHYVIPRIGTRRVAEIGVVDVADLLADLSREGLSAWTVRGCLTPLSRMFIWAVRNGWCGRNPVAELDRQERPKGDAKQMRILSSDEIQQVIAAATDTYKLLLMTAIFTGLRRGELLRLRWEDVDLLEGHLTVREAKTKAGEREVVLPPFLVQSLAKASLSHGEGLVFQTGVGTPMHPRNVNRGLEATLTRAGVPHVRFHDLRHTFASLLIAEGMDVTFVADQMGHANPATTLRIYARLFDPAQKKQQAREKIQNSFGALV